MSELKNKQDAMRCGLEEQKNASARGRREGRKGGRKGGGRDAARLKQRLT
jgi:hypothetical protein